AVAFTTNDSWSETAVTWNTQPVAGKRFATWTPSVSNALEFVVTPQVLDTLAGDHQLSVELFSVHNVGAAGTVDYASREYADVNARPQLRLFMAGSAPTISGLTNLSIAVNSNTGPLPFTIGDNTTPATNLVVTGASSNTNLVPQSGIVFSGSGSNRFVTVTPAANQ